MVLCGTTDGEMFVSVMLCMDRAVFGDGVVQVVVSHDDSLIWWGYASNCGSRGYKTVCLIWRIVFCKLLVFRVLCDPICCGGRTVGRSR